MQRHFIILGSNNFWCSNINVEKSEDVNKKIDNTIENLKKTLDPKNLPEDFVIYETVRYTPYKRINAETGEEII